MSASAKEKANQILMEASSKILEALSDLPDKGWEKPWSDHGLGSLPCNPLTGKTYSGFNLLLLLFETQMRGYGDPRYMTYKQAQDMGRKSADEDHEDDLPIHVKKGAKSILVFRPVMVKDDKEKSGDTSGNAAGESADNHKTILIGFRGYRVFNAQDIEGLPVPEPYEPRNWDEDPLIDNLISASGIQVEHNIRNRAFYRPREDKIYMPSRDAFPDMTSYYATLLHEWYHATGHDSRQNREGITGDNSLENYAKEELGAECFSLMASSLLGLPISMEDHAQYLSIWNKRLEDDPREIVKNMTAGARVLEAVAAFSQGERPDLDWWPGNSPMAASSEDGRTLMAM